MAKTVQGAILKTEHRGSKEGQCGGETGNIHRAGPEGGREASLDDIQTLRGQNPDNHNTNTREYNTHYLSKGN